MDLTKMFYKDVQKRLKNNKKILLSIEGNREEGMSAIAMNLQKIANKHCAKKQEKR